MAELMRAHTEWAKRPADERFLSLEELHAAVAARRDESWTHVTPVRDLRVEPVEDEIVVRTLDSTTGQERHLRPSHWSFGQLAQYAQAPAAYLRAVPAFVASTCLQYGMERNPIRNSGLVLGATNGRDVLRAITSTKYRRIWDQEVVELVQQVNGNGRWQVPAATYATQNPRLATTLYASDRDVFIFLVDPQNPVQFGNETLFRGFYCWNSEVGGATFGVTSFLYREVCDNRIIWGATDVQELRIRHTGGAIDRFRGEGAAFLRRYAEENTRSTVEAIQRAQAFELPDRKGGGTWADWLKDRKFSATEAKLAVETAESEEGGARSLWDIVAGLTAAARRIPHANERVALEAKAGALMEYAA